MPYFISSNCGKLLRRIHTYGYNRETVGVFFGTWEINNPHHVLVDTEVLMNATHALMTCCQWSPSQGEVLCTTRSDTVLVLVQYCSRGGPFPGRSCWDYFISSSDLASAGPLIL